jgi:hypothetical protein
MIWHLMNEPVRQWRGWVCLLFVFCLAAFFIEAREFATFAQTFIEIRNSWRPRQAVVEGTVIATSERRSSSTRTLAVAHITLFTVGAKVSYTTENQLHDAVALGWDERLRVLSQWEARDIQKGASITVRVSPGASDHVTLLGEWNAVSVTVFARLIATELALLGALVICGKFAIRRS